MMHGNTKLKLRLSNRNRFVNAVWVSCVALLRESQVGVLFNLPNNIRRGIQTKKCYFTQTLPFPDYCIPARLKFRPHQPILQQSLFFPQFQTIFHTQVKQHFRIRHPRSSITSSNFSRTMNRPGKNTTNANSS